MRSIIAKEKWLKAQRALELEQLDLCQAPPEACQVAPMVY
jgi:hypothetical protein